MMIPEWFGWTVLVALVGVVLAACKLLGWIALSWWWIALPLLPFVALAACIIVALLSWMASGSH